RFNPDYPVALLEDVVTTGGSTLTAVDAVEEAGGHVAVIITVVDREENDGMAKLRSRCPIVEALATRSQIVAASA
ncbi:MAG: orotate phosphoribosyltransferase, partial [Candidatus Binatia bacterium]